MPSAANPLPHSPLCLSPSREVKGEQRGAASTESSARGNITIQESASFSSRRVISAVNSPGLSIRRVSLEGPRRNEIVAARSVFSLRGALSRLTAARMQSHSNGTASFSLLFAFPLARPFFFLLLGCTLPGRADGVNSQDSGFVRRKSKLCLGRFLRRRSRDVVCYVSLKNNFSLDDVKSRLGWRFPRARVNCSFAVPRNGRDG